jgi:hypothetical protein
VEVQAEKAEWAISRKYYLQPVIEHHLMMVNSELMVLMVYSVLQAIRVFGLMVEDFSFQGMELPGRQELTVPVAVAVEEVAPTVVNCTCTYRGLLTTPFLIIETEPVPVAVVEVKAVALVKEVLAVKVLADLSEFSCGTMVSMPK